MARGRAITEDQKETFIACLRGGATVADAAKEIGFERRSMYTIRERDGDFAEAWAEAYDQGTMALEDEAPRRRAVQVAGV